MHGARRVLVFGLLAAAPDVALAFAPGVGMGLSLRRAGPPVLGAKHKDAQSKALLGMPRQLSHHSKRTNRNAISRPRRLTVVLVIALMQGRA
jgi:hypothetical protein